MAVTPRDAVRERARRMGAWLAAALLCAAILYVSGLTVRLVGGFFTQVRGLLRQLFF